MKFTSDEIVELMTWARAHAPYDSAPNSQLITRHRGVRLEIAAESCKANDLILPSPKMPPHNHIIARAFLVEPRCDGHAIDEHGSSVCECGPLAENVIA
jgi:hypothetical protein